MFSQASVILSTGGRGGVAIPWVDTPWADTHGQTPPWLVHAGIHTPPAHSCSCIVSQVQYSSKLHLKS